MNKMACLLVVTATTTVACGGSAGTGSGTSTETTASTGSSTSGGTGASTGSAGSGGAGSTSYLAGCTAYVDAMYATACPPTGQNQGQALAQCQYTAATAGIECLQEQGALYACLGAGGFACVQGQEAPNATCAAEETAYGQCIAAAPCNDYCVKATAGGCAGADCVDTCRAQEKMYGDPTADSYCLYAYDPLLECWGQKLVCAGGAPTAQGCESQVSMMAQCLSEGADDTCSAFCWAAGLAGCDGGCASDCAAKIADQDCGLDYQELVRCEIGADELDFTCTGGAPTPTSNCNFQLMQYQSCLMP